MLGRCHLEAVIGEGSSSQVYRGTHQTLNIPVAVKVRRADPLSLAHEGIVCVLDFDEDLGCLYLVMAYVYGYTLLGYLKHVGTVHEELAIRIIAFFGFSVADGARSIHCAS